MEQKTKHVQKIKPYTQYWERLANNMARSFCPNIYACAKCGNPVVSGYCCTGCGTGDPRSAQED
jgi:hypothetical protein